MGAVMRFARRKEGALLHIGNRNRSRWCADARGVTLTPFMEVLVVRRSCDGLLCGERAGVHEMIFEGRWSQGSFEAFGNVTKQALGSIADSGEVRTKLVRRMR